MSDSERIIKLKNFLDKSYNRVAEECGINNAQTLYDIKNGKHGISKDIADKISSRYLNISKQWLLTGEGEMVVSEAVTEAPSVATPAGISPALLDKALDEIAAQRRIAEKSQEQIDRLLSIIERMNGAK